MMMISRPRSSRRIRRSSWPVRAQWRPLAAHDGDELGAVGANHDGAGLATDLLGPNVARAEAESILFVVTNERLAAGIDEHDPTWFGENLAPALIAFPPRATEVIQALRSLWRGTRSNRGRGLGRRRRGRNRRGACRRRTALSNELGSWRRGLASGP